MISHIFTIRDAALDAYLQPFFSPTKGAAIRSLTEAANDPKHEFSRHAKDYTLYLVGSYDDSNGVITSMQPEPVIAVVDLLNKA